MLRSGSAALQRLTRMVGKSRQIYKVGMGMQLTWRSKAVQDAPPRPPTAAPGSWEQQEGCAWPVGCALWLACLPAFANVHHAAPFVCVPATSSAPRGAPPLSILRQGIVELCILRYRDSDSLYVGMAEAALCALRSQVSCNARRAVDPGIPAWGLTGSACSTRLRSCLPGHSMCNMLPCEEEAGAWHCAFVSCPTAF